MKCIPIRCSQFCARASMRRIISPLLWLSTRLTFDSHLNVSSDEWMNECLMSAPLQWNPNYPPVKCRSHTTWTISFPQTLTLTPILTECGITYSILDLGMPHKSRVNCCKEPAKHLPKVALLNLNPLATVCKKLQIFVRVKKYFKEYFCLCCNFWSRPTIG